MQTDIFAQIRADHRVVADLIKQFRDRDGGDARGEADEIGNLLLPHAMAEEVTLYPALHEHEKPRKHVDKAIEEHRAIEQRLNELARAETGNDKERKSRLKKLEREIQHHVKGEEGKTFDYAQDLLTDEQIMNLSRRFPQEKENMRGQWRLAA